MCTAYWQNSNISEDFKFQSKNICVYTRGWKEGIIKNWKKFGLRPNKRLGRRAPKKFHLNQCAMPPGAFLPAKRIIEQTFSSVLCFHMFCSPLLLDQRCFHCLINQPTHPRPTGEIKTNKNLWGLLQLGFGKKTCRSFWRNKSKRGK